MFLITLWCWHMIRDDANKGIYIGISVIVLILLLMVVVFMISKSKSPQDCAYVGYSWDKLPAVLHLYMISISHKFLDYFLVPF